MMRSYLALIPLLLVAVTGFCGPADEITVSIPIVNRPASKILSFLNRQNGVGFPAGVRSVTPNNRDTALIAIGSDGGIRELKARVNLLDIHPKSVRLDFRVLRFQMEDSTEWDVDAVASPTIVTENNEPASISIRDNGSHLSIEILPRVNGDESISLFSTLAVRSIGTGQIKVTANKRVAAGKRIILGGATDNKDPEVQAAIKLGVLPHVPGKYTVYFLQVTPSIVREVRN